jgi:glycosyltransferase involved in cell wall biosynthesis
MHNEAGIAIISVSYPPLVGGAEVQLKNLASYLSRNAHPVSVFTYAVKNSAGEEVLDGVFVKRVKIAGSGRLAPLSFMLLSALALLGRSKSFAIIQAHQLPMGIVAGVIGAVLRKKTIVKIEGLEDIYRYKKSILKTWILRKTIDRFITLGPKTTDALKSIVGVPENKIVYIPNAFETAFKDDPSRNKKEKNVIFVARLEHEKAPEVLIKAWKQVLKTHHDAKLVLLGEGRKRSELEKLVAELGIAGSVELKGSVPNVKDYLSQAMVFVLPSRIEGVPISMLEAMAAGVPVIVTPVGDIPDIIKHEENGILVSPDNNDELGAAIVGLLKDGEKRSRLAEKARLSVEAFSMDVVGMQYRDLYRKLAS